MIQTSAHGFATKRGGSVYLRLSTRALEQPRDRAGRFHQGVIDGAYWLREPGLNAEVIIGYQGCIAQEAIEAVGLIGEDRRCRTLAITSADRLNAGWHADSGRASVGTTRREAILTAA